MWVRVSRGSVCGVEGRVSAAVARGRGRGEMRVGFSGVGVPAGLWKDGVSGAGVGFDEQKGEAFPAWGLTGEGRQWEEKISFNRTNRFGENRTVHPDYWLDCQFK